MRITNPRLIYAGLQIRRDGKYTKDFAINGIVFPLSPKMSKSVWGLSPVCPVGWTGMTDVACKLWVQVTFVMRAAWSVLQEESFPFGCLALPRSNSGTKGELYC